jgi:hypothetical protein
MYLPVGEEFDKPEEPIYLACETFSWPPHMRYEISLQDCPSFVGDNELGIRLRKLLPGRAINPVMEALEVRVY